MGNQGAQQAGASRPPSPPDQAEPITLPIGNPEHPRHTSRSRPHSKRQGQLVTHRSDQKEANYPIEAQTSTNDDQLKATASHHDYASTCDDERSTAPQPEGLPQEEDERQHIVHTTCTRSDDNKGAQNGQSTYRKTPTPDQPMSLQDDNGLPHFMATIGYPHLHTALQDEVTADYAADLEGAAHPDALGDESAHTPMAVCDFTKWPFPHKDMRESTVRIYEAVKGSSTYNHIGKRITLHTDLNLDVWDREATQHPQDKMVLEGIRYGFPIQFNGPPMYSDKPVQNHPSAERHPDHIRKYIQTELQHKEGPFDKPPFIPWCVVSPLMTREKQDPSSRRIIVDLSYPDGGINQHIRQHIYNGQEVAHNLPTIDMAVRSIAHMCPGEVHMSVIDLSRAYRQFPVMPTDWPLLGISFAKEYYFDHRIPFGARMSSFVMQAIADFITRALSARLISAHMYLDDIVIVAPTKALAERHYKTTIHLLQELGLQVAVKKLQPPSQQVTWLGIQFDIAKNQLSMPHDKLQKIKRCMATAAVCTRISKKHLQRIIGLANHLAKVVRAARVFICRLLAALRATASETIIVSHQVKADLKWFADYVTDYNGRAIMPTECVVRRIWADACLVGAGASDRDHYYTYKFPSAVTANHNITQLEAINCLAAVRLMVSDADGGGTIMIYCDNRPAVDALTSGRARNEVLAAVARAMWFHAAATDTNLRFSHVPGEAMALPDALSRVHVDPISKAKANRFIADLSLRPVEPATQAFTYQSFL